MNLSMKKRLPLALALGGAAALVWFGATRLETGRMGDRATHDPEATPMPSTPPPPRPRDLSATRTPVSSCAEGFATTGADECTPVDPATGAPYTAAELARFDRIRASGAVGSKNFFVPRIMTAAECQRRAQLFAEMNDLRQKILNKAATPEQIDIFFNFRERITSYRMQLITQMHIEGGGRITRNDPTLDPSDIEDPAVQAEYTALTEEAQRDELARREARLAHGMSSDDVVPTTTTTL